MVGTDLPRGHRRLARRSDPINGTQRTVNSGRIQLCSMWGGRCVLCGYRSLNWTFVICDGMVIGAEVLIDELENNKI